MVVDLQLLNGNHFLHCSACFAHREQYYLGQLGGGSFFFIKCDPIKISFTNGSFPGNFCFALPRICLLQRKLESPFSLMESNIIVHQESIILKVVNQCFPIFFNLLLTEFDSRCCWTWNRHIELLLSNIVVRGDHRQVEGPHWTSLGNSSLERKSEENFIPPLATKQAKPVFLFSVKAHRQLRSWFSVSDKEHPFWNILLWPYSSCCCIGSLEECLASSESDSFS